MPPVKLHVLLAPVTALALFLVSCSGQAEARNGADEVNVQTDHLMTGHVVSVEYGGVEAIAADSERRSLRGWVESVVYSSPSPGSGQQITKFEFRTEEGETIWVQILNPSAAITAKIQQARDEACLITIEVTELNDEYYLVGDEESIILDC